jgi:hypothetical protein
VRLSKGATEVRGLAVTILPVEEMEITQDHGAKILDAP